MYFDGRNSVKKIMSLYEIFRYFFLYNEEILLQVKFPFLYNKSQRRASIVPFLDRFSLIDVVYISLIEKNSSYISVYKIFKVIMD